MSHARRAGPNRRQACGAALGIAAGALPGFGGLLATAPAAAATLAAGELALPGRLLLLRHANAPGIGDPPGFRLGDCATQRNLDAAGRNQARELGTRLRAAGVQPAAVLSSQWCRCLETARLLALGPVTEEPALNSFFGRADTREPQLERLRQRIAALPADAPPVLMVTHQVVVTSFTGAGIASGGGAVFQLNGSGMPRLLGEL